jgi:hypothetical protein
VTFDRELELTAERLRLLPAVRLLPAEQRFRHVLALCTERAVPRIAPHAWGDQLLVVGREVEPGRHGAVAEVLRDLRRSLDITPV